MLKDEFLYYLSHWHELCEKHDGKFIVIKDQNVIGVYDDEMEAIEKTALDHELGTFLVQELRDPDELKRTFHSRVVLI